MNLADAISAITDECGFSTITVYAPRIAGLPDGEEKVQAILLAVDDENLHAACKSFLEEEKETR